MRRIRRSHPTPHTLGLAKLEAVLATSGLAPLTVRTYQYNLCLFWQWLTRTELAFDALTPADLLSYRQRLVTPRTGPTTSGTSARRIRRRANAEQAVQRIWSNPTSCTVTAGGPFRTAFGTTICRELVGDLHREGKADAEERRKALCCQYMLKAVRLCLDTLARFERSDPIR